MNLTGYSNHKLWPLLEFPLVTVDSIDLNPVICNASGWVATDARMMLSK